MDNKQEPNTEARVVMVCPLIECAHQVVARARVIREMRADGGDGPYCIKCHEAGRPDMKLIVWPTQVGLDLG